MKNLFELLERFSKSLNQDQFTKDTIIATIENQTKIKLSPEKVSLKEGVLEIVATPVVKSEIALREQDLKQDLKSKNIFVSRILYK